MKKAFILAGGVGKRLRPYTFVIPKPLVPIGEDPIIRIVLKRLINNGFKDITISLGYMGEMLTNAVNSWKLPAKIKFVTEEKPLGTAGSLSLLENFDCDLLVTNGDLLTNLNLSGMYDFHKKNKAAATIGLFTREVKIDFGVIKVGEKNSFQDYIEKPTYMFDVSMGINILSPKVKKYIKKGRYLDMPNLINLLHKKGEKVMCYKEKCKWLDIGRDFDYNLATEEFDKCKKEYI